MRSTHATSSTHATHRLAVEYEADAKGLKDQEHAEHGQEAAD
jgi:hypothetical protein